MQLCILTLTHTLTAHGSSNGSLSSSCELRSSSRILPFSLSYLIIVLYSVRSIQGSEYNRALDTHILPPWFTRARFSHRCVSGVVATNHYFHLFVPDRGGKNKQKKKKKKKREREKSMYIEPINPNNTITSQNHEYQTCIKPLSRTNPHKIPTCKDLLRQIRSHKRPLK